MQAADLYFNLLLAQVNLEIANHNLSNTDTLYHISTGRYNLGKIAENDLLQMELAVMNSRNNVAQGQLDVQLGRLRLKNFLNMQELVDLQLTEPARIPEFKVDLAVALEQARKNRQEMIEFERLHLEADRDVARAKGETGFNANLFATYGLTQSAAVIENAYMNPLEQQSLRIGFQVPVLDWGRAKSQIKIAEANRELMELTIQQAQQNFEQEIILLATQAQMHREKLKISIQADTIAQRRYEISMQRYLIGKIGILDINVALDERVQARRSYVAAMRDFWITYYDLRRKTLYDFERGMEIAN
jgi:outer membrane protein